MKKNLTYQLIILVGAALLFIPFIGRVHLFDWDEINFAESAREMLTTGDYLTVRIFFEPFWEKPPLFIWMQVISMKIFGVNEFAARFPNAVCGIVTLLLLFNIGRKLIDRRFGLLWVIAFGCSLLPFFYFKSGIIDPWFNLFIFLSLCLWVYATDAKQNNLKYLFALLSAISLGMAILTKGPVSILVFGMVVFVLFVFNRFRIGLNWKQILIFIFAVSITGCFWFILQMLSGNTDIVRDFIAYQIRLFETKDAGHGGFPFYHFIILLFGVFPASIFAIQGHRYPGASYIRKSFHIAMIALLWVVLVLFSLVRTKIVHYSSLTYFPLTYLAACSGYMIIAGKFRFQLWQKILLAAIGTFLSFAVILLPVFMNNKQFFIDRGIITHSFTIGNLQANPGWNWHYSLIGVILVAGIFITILLSRKRKLISILTIYAASLIFIFLTITFITPGAELISQRAAIDFIQKKAKEDVYIKTFYKSYATLFYGHRKLPENMKVFSTNWLTKGKIDKDAYFIFRIDKKEEVLDRYPNINILYEKNGYVFCVRHAIIGK
jgi:4-amino-4-deoxy-L-arabinose transferase-like glycosyltransferase